MARKSRKFIQTETTAPVEYTRQFSAALYVRLSNEERFDRANKNSFKNQKSFLLDYVERHPEINIYKIYEDNGNTGTNFDRPAFSEMMYDVSNEKVDCIIVKDLSRFGREHIEMGKYLEYLFPMIGLRFIAINDNYDTYDKIKKNDMIVPFKNIINSVYSKDISRKVISSLSLKQHRGEFLGTFATYGYNLDERRHFIIDDYAMGIVNRIFDMMIEFRNMSRIAKILTREGIDTPAMYRYKQGIIKNKKLVGSNLWNSSTIKSILTNLAYVGHMVQGKTKSLFLDTGNKKMVGVDRKAWIIVENTHEAGVSQEKFDAVQNIIEEISKANANKRKNHGPNSNNIFRSKLYCGDCGRPLIYKEKGKWKFYNCGRHACYPDKCSFMSIKYMVLSDVVFNSIKAYILTMLDFDNPIVDCSNTAKVRQQKQNFESGIRGLKGKLQKTRNQRFALYRDYIEELIIADEFNFARESYSNEIELLEDRLAALEKEYEHFKISLEPKEWVERFKKYKSSKHLTREMVEYFIDRITVGTDKTIHIKWRFTKEQLWEAGEEV